MTRVFLSHCSAAIRRALLFKKHMCSGSPELEVFLSSDWNSVRSGEIWVQEVEEALRQCDHFVAILTSRADSTNPWMNYEVGFARGRGLPPKIFLFDSVTPAEVALPISMLFLIRPGDTTRRDDELLAIGVLDAKTAPKSGAFGKTVYLRDEPRDI